MAKAAQSRKRKTGTGSIGAIVRNAKTGKKIRKALVCIKRKTKCSPPSFTSTTKGVLTAIPVDAGVLYRVCATAHGYVGDTKEESVTTGESKEVSFALKRAKKPKEKPSKAQTKK